MNTASRTQAFAMMQGFGHLPNGSMAPYTALGAANNGKVEWLPLVGVGLMWIGMDFPGTQLAVDIFQALTDQPKKTIQAFSLLAGGGLVLSAVGA